MLSQTLGTGTSLIISVTITEHRGMSRKITTLSQSPQKSGFMGTDSHKPKTWRTEVGWFVWNLSYSISLLQHLSATFPLQGSWRLIEVRRKWVSEKDQVSSVSVKLLEHVLNPESHHPSYFSIHPFLLMQHLMILLISHIFLLGIIFLQKKIQLSFSVFQLSWPILQNTLNCYGLKQSWNKWPLMSFRTSPNQMNFALPDQEGGSSC